MTRNKNKPRTRKRRQGGGDNFDEREVEKAFMNLKKNLPQSPQDWYEAYNRAKAGAATPANLKDDAKNSNDIKCPQKRGLPCIDEDHITKKKPSLNYNKSQELTERNKSKPNQSNFPADSSKNFKNLTMYERLKIMDELLDGSFSSESEASVARNIMNSLKNSLEEYKQKISPIKDVTIIDGNSQKMETDTKLNSTRSGNKTSLSDSQSPRKNTSSSADRFREYASSGPNQVSTSKNMQTNLSPSGKVEKSKETFPDNKRSDLYHRRETYPQSRSLLGDPFEQRKNNVGQNLSYNSNKSSGQGIQAQMGSNRGSSSKNWEEKNMSSTTSNNSTYSSRNSNINQFHSKTVRNYTLNIPDEGSNELYERRERNPQTTQPFSNQSRWNSQRQNETKGNDAFNVKPTSGFASGTNWERRSDETASSNTVSTNSDQLPYYRRSMPTNYPGQMRSCESNELYERRETVDKCKDLAYDFQNPNRLQGHNPTGNNNSSFTVTHTKNNDYEPCGLNWERRSKESLGHNPIASNSNSNFSAQYQSNSRHGGFHTQEGGTTKQNTYSHERRGSFAPSSNGPSEMNWRGKRESAMNPSQGSNRFSNRSNPNFSSYDRGNRYGSWMKNGQERNFSGSKNVMNRFSGTTY